VLDLAGFDYDYENDDEEDALRVCRRFTALQTVSIGRTIRTDRDDQRSIFLPDLRPLTSDF